MFAALAPLRPWSRASACGVTCSHSQSAPGQPPHMPCMVKSRCQHNDVQIRNLYNISSHVGLLQDDFDHVQGAEVATMFLCYMTFNSLRHALAHVQQSCMQHPTECFDPQCVDASRWRCAAVRMSTRNNITMMSLGALPGLNITSWNVYGFIQVSLLKLERWTGGCPRGSYRQHQAAFMRTCSSRTCGGMFEIACTHVSAIGTATDVNFFKWGSVLLRPRYTVSMCGVSAIECRKR
jgi:hypothetical protein